MELIEIRSFEIVGNYFNSKSLGLIFPIFNLSFDCYNGYGTGINLNYLVWTRGFRETAISPKSVFYIKEEAQDILKL